jgi:hypothetical protein
VQEGALLSLSFSVNTHSGNETVQRNGHPCTPTFSIASSRILSKFFKMSVLLDDTKQPIVYVAVLHAQCSIQWVLHGAATCHHPLLLLTAFATALLELALSRHTTHTHSLGLAHAMTDLTLSPHTVPLIRYLSRTEQFSACHRLHSKALYGCLCWEPFLVLERYDGGQRMLLLAACAPTIMSLLVAVSLCVLLISNQSPHMA